MDELWWVAYGNTFSGRYVTREKAQIVVDSPEYEYQNRGVFVEVQAYDKAVQTLQEIKDTQGQVCDDYALCEHASCSSSYTSWAIADKFLTGR